MFEASVADDGPLATHGARLDYGHMPSLDSVLRVVGTFRLTRVPTAARCFLGTNLKGRGVVMRLRSRKRMRLVALVGAALGFGILAPVGAAEPPTNPQCWGVVTSQRASTEHDVGQHASAQSEPRLGIGNVAELFTGSHQPGQLGSVLAGLDELAATHCP
jgi:hypothetical protein